MSYNGLVAIIKKAAESVNREGTFVHGRRVLASHEYNMPMPQIHLYPVPFAIDNDGDNETHTCLVGVWYQDAPDSSPEQEQALLAKAEILASNFIQALKDSGNQPNGLQLEPGFKLFAACLSGFSLRFTLFLKTDC